MEIIRKSIVICNLGLLVVAFSLFLNSMLTQTFYSGGTGVIGLLVLIVAFFFFFLLIIPLYLVDRFRGKRNLWCLKTTEQVQTAIIIISFMIGAYLSFSLFLPFPYGLIANLINLGVGGFYLVRLARKKFKFQQNQ